jgi:hypothetical protein
MDIATACFATHCVRSADLQSASSCAILARMKRQTIVALACLLACHKTETAQTTSNSVDAAPAAAADADLAAATDSDAAVDDTATDVAPPAAVVAADPNIPLNEAVVGAAPTAPDYFADTAPPAPVVEDKPPMPEATDTWVPGYWWWSHPLNRYVWVSGAWRNPPPEQTWTPGSWNLANGHYGWTAGYWAPHGYAREVIAEAPPPLRVEVRPAMPGAGFVWTPGFYEHTGGAYVWKAGAWARPPSAGVAWVEPRYVNTGGHYYLQPGRWDFAPEHRGVVYRPDIDVRPGAKVVLAPVAATVVTVHANYVADSAHAIARGATRAPNGHLVVTPHANVVVNEHVNVNEHVDVHGATPRAPDVHIDTRVVTPQVHVNVTTPQPRKR